MGRNTWGAKNPMYEINHRNFVLGVLIHTQLREHQPTSKVEDTVDDTDPGSLVQEKKTEYYESDDTCGQSDLDCQYVKYAKAAEKGLKDGTCADQGCPHETGTQTKTYPIIGDIVVTTYDKAGLAVADTCSLYEIADDTCGQSDLDCQYVKYAKAVCGGVELLRIAKRAGCWQRRRRLQPGLRPRLRGELRIAELSSERRYSVGHRTPWGLRRVTKKLKSSADACSRRRIATSSMRWTTAGSKEQMLTKSRDVT